MNKNIFKFLNKHYSQKPDVVDRLLISAYLSANKIAVKKNRLLKSYQIQESDTKQYKGLIQFQTALKNYEISLNTESLIELFEFVISPEDRIITGAVYTPAVIRNYIIKNCLHDPEQLPKITVADISCGCGGFLYSAAKAIQKKTGRSYFKIFKEQIFGLDIQDYSVTRTKLLLSLLAVEENEDKEHFEFNLFTGNALNFSWEKKISSFVGFHAIVGNPPYVCSRNISKESRALLGNWEVCSTGHPDLYIPFFQIGIENLRAEGILGYITMNTFFKSVNGRALRLYFKKEKFSFSIIDFGALQVFHSKSTYTCLCFISKSNADDIKYFKCEDTSLLPSSPKVYHSVSYISLPDKEGWNLSNKGAIIAKIENTGKPLSSLFGSRNGIATLKNSVYIFTPSGQTKRYYRLTTTAGEIFSIEKKICRDIVNPNVLTRETSLAKIKEKIIFPYHVNEKDAVALTETEMKNLYPKTLAYLETQKTVLATRDKGGGINYKPWFAYGRNQSLEKLKHKLLFPHITPQIPNYVLDANENLLIYNGIAIIGKSRRELLILKKIMSSRLFWFYIKHTSRHYGSSYLSLSKNYIRNFGIYAFTPEEEEFLLKEENEAKANLFIEKRYNITAAELLD